LKTLPEIFCQTASICEKTCATASPVGAARIVRIIRVGSKRFNSDLVMLKRLLTVIAGLAPLLIWAADQKDISGTWIARRTTPMGEMETVYEFKVEAGKLGGNVSGPFGDMPIVGG